MKTEVMKMVNEHYINGRFVASHGTEVMDIINPASGAVIGQVTLGDEEDARSAIRAAKSAFKTYAGSSLEQRGRYLQQLHDAIIARADEHIAIRTEEYGGVAQHSQFSIAGAAKVFLNMRKSLGEIVFSKRLGAAEVVLRPLGVAALITPWNSALFMVCNKLAPALAAGCTVVIKSSELSALQIRLLMECVDAAGLPPGVVNIVHGRGEVVGNELTLHPDVAKVSFTGSTAVGKRVMRNAADTMKRVTLELGGKSAHIILDDADLGLAIPFALACGFMNNGQACIAGSRILVPEHKLPAVKAALLEGMKKWIAGPPAQAATALGPLVSQRQFERVQHYIRKGIEDGAQVLVGGEGKPPGLEAGHFVKPTIFVNVSNDMRIAREEIFGPVLAVIGYRSEEEAIEIANDTPYGLQGWISTADPQRGRRIAGRIEAGMVMVNRVYDLLDDAGAPAGGFKQSGIGREFGVYGIGEYLEPQSIFA
ncbi:aldehyde dehydrogenase family protein [Janthinobacterium agaricidamnosum]|uniref:aldehyde dehydrogenase (NAD(+)) n=1 Tax=Janthinobacterium agaricidamnosum NBRC 102515 = DSM 9628 TaxID=1349767 RepID=W0V710_9BURK|nr:aldehyde dehydrogenase family protein [Janthinobacterium agaricidamnosum]CDG83390.1 aldehyde dehydrogenase family protein [Janthinobacterium agaricidamnosum NBRC 102515 = DSM 9628]